MKIQLKKLTIVIALSTALTPLCSQAASDSVKVGFISDMSGVYADLDGPGGIEAVKLAVHDFGGKVLNKPIEIFFADHQNKTDIAVSVARKWWDRDHVDLIVSGSNSAVSLAISTISKEEKKVFISSGAGADRLTEEACQPYMVRYTYSASAQTLGTVANVVRNGGKNWFFITADYAFGHAVEKASAAVIAAEGGKVLGNFFVPSNTTDFSSYLLQAQSSKAQILGLANARGNIISTIKQAKEFGIAKTMNLVGLIVFITDIHSLGLDATSGMYLTDGWYWDKNDATRTFANHFYDKEKKMPTTLQAGAYSSVLTYLKAVQAAGTTDSDPVMKRLKSMKIDDMFAKGYIRADGAMVHDMYLMQVKAPAESKREWDYYKLVATIPGNQAYAPTKTGVCSLMPKA